MLWDETHQCCAGRGTYSYLFVHPDGNTVCSLLMLVTVFGRVEGNFATVRENHYLTYNSHIYRAVRSSAATFEHIHLICSRKSREEHYIEQPHATEQNSVTFSSSWCVMDVSNPS